MAERICFHLDEHVDPDIARALRRYGVDVPQPWKLGCVPRATQRSGRMCAERTACSQPTMPAFLRLASEGQEHPGVAYCHKATRSVGDIIRSLILIYEVLMPEEMAGRVEYL